MLLTHGPDISDSHSFARRFRSFKRGSLLIPGLALGRWEVVVCKKRAEPMHCSLFVISGFLSSQGASPQVLSAFAGLTAVFGMGTGGSPQLSPLNFLKGPCPYNCIKRTSLTSLRSVYGSFLRTCFQIPSPTPFGSKRLAPVCASLLSSFKQGSLLKSSPRSISTGPLRASLHFHSRPIYHVVFMGPYLLSQ